MEWTNPDSYNKDGTLEIALCEVVVGTLESDEARLAVQAVGSNKANPSTNQAAYVSTNVATFYPDENAAAQSGYSDARVKINQYNFAKVQKTAAGCPILPLPAFKQTQDWAKTGTCSFEQIHVIAYFDGQKVGEISKTCAAAAKPTAAK